MTKTKFQIKPKNSFFFIVAAVCVWATTSFAQPVINELRFEKTSDHEERVLLVMEKFQPPKAFDLPDPNPRLVFDFFDTTLQRSVTCATTTEGNLVKKIRMARHSSPQKKVRLVLDLATDYDYNVNQVFFEKNSVYAIIVTIPD